MRLCFETETLLACITRYILYKYLLVPSVYILEKKTTDQESVIATVVEQVFTYSAEL